MTAYSEFVRDLARRLGLTVPPEDHEHQSPYERDLLNGIANFRRQCGEAERTVRMLEHTISMIKCITAKGDPQPDDYLTDLITDLGAQSIEVLTIATRYEAARREVAVLADHYQRSLPPGKEQ